MLPRPVLTAAIAALAFAPAAAAKSDEADRLGEALRDPAAQQATAAAAAAMSEALLNIRVAPLLEAIETAKGVAADEVDPDLTLRDYAGPEAERLPEEVSRRLPALMGAMGNMTGALETMLPELRAMARMMGEQMDQPTAR